MTKFCWTQKICSEIRLDLELSWSSNGLISEFGWHREADQATDQKTAGVISAPPEQLLGVVSGLRAFFEKGEPLSENFWNLLDLSETSEFGRQVYQTTCKIPYGETRTYSWIAQRLGKPGATRAVGQALRRNPFLILVPCHRVVSERGLGGFMGVDDPLDVRLKVKNYLQECEMQYRSPFFSFAELGIWNRASAS